MTPGRHLPASISNYNWLTRLDLLGWSSLEVTAAPLSLRRAAADGHSPRCHGGMQELPESIGLLSRLTLVNLKGCSSLRGLPASIGQLDSLNELDLCGCSQLISLPESLAECSSLTWLDVSRCRSLQARLFSLPVHLRDPTADMRLTACPGRRRCLLASPGSLGSHCS